VGDTVRRAEFHFDGGRGRLFGRRWEGPAPRREVVLVHGYGEHSGRYEHVGRFLAERGARVHAYDHQGHGRSSGPRCHVRRFADFLDDLERVVERARRAGRELPVYVIGHSMGGLVACAWARERRPDVAGLVVSAPALAAPGGPSPALLRLLPLASRIAPRLALDSELDPQGLSRDPAVVEAYLADPLVHLRMTLSLARELFAAMARTAGGGAELGLPALMLHGADDPICSPDASRRFAEAAPDCRYRSYPRLRHEIFNEPERDEVLADVQAWIEEREPARGNA
jgi:alpha-beta hydrolase superfamily lysophospholipase